MSDKQALLAAIRANPDEDTPRLMYADYLDEHGAGDLDRATAEFIRLSCPMRAPKNGWEKPAMPRDCYPWLRDLRYHEVSNPAWPAPIVVANYRRFVPGLLALHTPIHSTDTPPEERDGRRIHVVLRLALPTSPGVQAILPTATHYRRPTPVSLWFRRGFLEAWRVHHAAGRALVAPAIAADQPLAVDLVEREAKYATVRSGARQLAGTGEL